MLLLYHPKENYTLHSPSKFNQLGETLFRTVFLVEIKHVLK